MKSMDQLGAQGWDHLEKHWGPKIDGFICAHILDTGTDMIQTCALQNMMAALDSDYSEMKHNLLYLIEQCENVLLGKINRQNTCSWCTCALFNCFQPMGDVRLLELSVNPLYYKALFNCECVEWSGVLTHPLPQVVGEHQVSGEVVCEVAVKLQNFLQRVSFDDVEVAVGQRPHVSAGLS